MSNAAPIVFFGSLAVGVGALLYWGASTKDSVEKMSLVVDSIKKKSIKLDHSVHTAKITLLNFSSNAIDIDYPSIKVKHEGQEVGFSFPKDSQIHIPKKGKATVEIDFRINQVEAIISLLTTPKLSFTIQVITNINGLEVSKSVKYDLTQA